MFNPREQTAWVSVDRSWALLGMHLFGCCRLPSHLAAPKGHEFVQSVSGGGVMALCASIPPVVWYSLFITTPGIKEHQLMWVHGMVVFLIGMQSSKLGEALSSPKSVLAGTGEGGASKLESC